MDNKKVICIAGYSGSGGTTVGKALKEYLRAFYLTGDKFQLPNNFPTQFKKIYNEEFNPNDIARAHYLIRTATQTQLIDYFELTLSKVNASITKEAFEQKNNIGQ